MADPVSWQLSGDYFENCSCSVLCPCLVSTSAPLAARPTEGHCNVPLVFHIEQGRYGDVVLDGLNAFVILRSPGVMADGDWTAATYVDERADDAQAAALEAIFSGAAGGPMAAFGPLVAHVLPTRKVPITFRIDGKTRSAEIPGILKMAVDPLPTLHPGGEMWANIGHPVSPDRMALGVGAEGNVFDDHGMHWDNSGRNGLYAAIHWSSQS